MTLVVDIGLGRFEPLVGFAMLERLVAGGHTRWYATVPSGLVRPR